MNDKEFNLRYLPLFVSELEAIRDYIALNLNNPEAAFNLVEEVEAAILKRLENPLSFEPYPSLKKRRYPYYRIYVKNFIVFYVVIDNIMEVRRILYGKRNLLDI